MTPRLPHIEKINGKQQLQQRNTNCISNAIQMQHLQRLSVCGCFRVCEIKSFAMTSHAAFVACDAKYH